jgi:hypothetical protein
MVETIGLFELPEREIAFFGNLREAWLSSYVGKGETGRGEKRVTSTAGESSARWSV